MIIKQKIKNFLYRLYLLWERLVLVRRKRIQRQIDKFAYKPKISIITPVYKIEPGLLRDAIESLLAQLYSNWELCIADDASGDTEIKRLLTEYRENDSRIHVTFLSENSGISAASNEALAMASGEYIALLDHDDMLNQTCLYEVVKLLNRERAADIIYSNEDKLTMDGRRMNPELKPAWRESLFLTYNYINHVTVCRKEIIDRIGGFRLGFEGSQDYDLLLRATELTDRIYHIPKFLYHWRMIPGSTAEVVDAKDYAFERSKKALRDAMERRGIKAIVRDGMQVGHFEVVYED